MTEKAYTQALSALMNVQILALDEQLTQKENDKSKVMRDLFNLTTDAFVTLRDYARKYGFDEEPQV